MKKAFKTIAKDKMIIWGFALSVIILFAVAIYIVIVYPQLPPVLPIYNRLAWGYSRLGTKLEIFIPFGLALVFCLFNLFLAAAVYNKVALISRMIAAISFTLVLCTSIYILKIMQLIL